jgi:hypothetical protein
MATSSGRSVPDWLIVKARLFAWIGYPNWTPDERLIAYIDGSCLHNGQESPRAGVGVWFGEGHPL